MAKVLIGGDLYPGSQAVELLKSGDTNRVFQDLLPVIAGADLAIANLEGPFISEPAPIEKIGPHHGFDTACAAGLARAGFSLLNLGNNHTMDHGVAGLTTTLQCCREHHIAHVGAGRNLQEAGQPLIREIAGERIAFLSYTEFEFGIAGANQDGTHPIDPLHFVRTVERERSSWDRLIVLLHAGNEYYPYPRPPLRDLARFMCEQGAAAVIFQHSHCAGCWEEHKGGFIVYGQGNLLFDTRGAHPCELEGMLVLLEFNGTAPARMELVPYAQSPSGTGPQLLAGAQRDAFLLSVRERSRSIQEPGFVEQQWERFTAESPYNYLALIHGYSQRLRELDRKFDFLKHLYSPKRMRMLLHLLRCESHREALITALSSALKR